MRIGFLRLKRTDLEFHARTSTACESAGSAPYVAVEVCWEDAAGRRATTIHQRPKVLLRQASLPSCRRKNGRQGKRVRPLAYAKIPPLAARPAGRFPLCGAEGRRDAVGEKE